MRKTRTLFFLTSVLALGACGTMMEGQAQKVTILTPGASESQCTLDNGVRYPAMNGQTVNVQRSPHSMVIECYGSGDRYQKKIVESTFNPWSAGNVITGVVPGVAYDHVTGGLYEYPDRIEIDFTGTPTRGFETPQYLNKDAPNPYAQAIESYGAAEPKLATDGTYLPRGIGRTTPTVGGNPFEGLRPSPSGTVNAPTAITPSAAAPSTVYAPPRSNAGPMESVTEQLNRSMNPTVFGQ